MNSKSLLRPDALSTGQPLLNGDLMLYSACVADSPALFHQLLNTILWQQGYVTLYGKRHLIPRLQAWYGDPDAGYRYSGEALTPLPWTAELKQLKDELQTMTGLPLNSVLANLYRNGQDKMGWHADDETELGEQPQILSLSLGACRDFALRPKGASRQHSQVALTDGSLLWMKAGMQSRWQHALPARARVTTPRINLTFRLVNQ